MRRFLVTAGTVLALGGVSATGALAANPGTQGQPSQSCQDPSNTNSPPGLTTSAFLNTATSVYAAAPGTGSTAHSTVANNPHTVSQYDVACFQVSQPHP